MATLRGRRGRGNRPGHRNVLLRPRGAFHSAPVRQEHADRHRGHTQRSARPRPEDLLPRADRQGRREAFQGLRAAALKIEARAVRPQAEAFQRRDGAAFPQRQLNLHIGRDQSGRPWHADGQIHHRRGIQPGRRDRQTDPRRHGTDHEHETALHRRPAPDLDTLDRRHGRFHVPQRPARLLPRR